MVYLIILTITGILGIILAIKKEGIFHKIISFGLFIPILTGYLMLIGFYHSITISMFLWIVLGILTIIYGVTVKNITILERLCIIIISFFASMGSFVHFGFDLFWFNLISQIPIIIYLIHLFVKKKLLSKEMSFMIVWIVMIISEFVGSCLMVETPQNLDYFY